MKRKILLGLTGSVATVLYRKLIEQLQALGDVSVILTGKSMHFVDMKTLCDALESNGNKGFLYTEEDEWTWSKSEGVLTTKWHKNDEVLHISLRDEFSALVIAPCSANTMGKMASGICDNLLTCVARAWDLQRPIIIAPAMNTHMWDHPVTKENIEKLKSWGYKFVNPQSKLLACGTHGFGAMAEIDEIVKLVKESLQWLLPIPHYAFSGIPVENHPGAFACKRKHERHTGVDLYTTESQIVTAVEAGTVVGIEHFTGEWDKSPWWNNTDCILIEGATGVVCYGEVEIPNWVNVGDKVRRGQYIANVKRVLKEGKERTDIPGHSTSMLHMELYPHGTVRASDGFESDLLNDPTPLLFDAVNGNELKELTYA